MLVGGLLGRRAGAGNKDDGEQSLSPDSLALMR